MYRILATMLAVSLLSVGALGAQRVELPDLEELEGDPIHTVLEPDQIPAIDDPQMVPAEEATFMDDHEPVVGVYHRGVAKAYSLWHLDRHEIVNDLFADEPVAVTW